MDVSGFWPVFGTGAFGAVLLEVLRWWKLREAFGFPAYASSPFYWAITVAMICASGLLATLYGVDTRNALMVANVGASAPALIGSLATAGSVQRNAREVRGSGKSAGQGSMFAREQVRRFLAFGR
jgi:hypothetical protein